MEISKSDLRENYRKMENNELLDMYLSRAEYTDIAVEAMQEEISSRGLDEDDFDAFLQHQVLQKDEQFQRENFKELSFLEKVLFYLISMIAVGFLIFFIMLKDRVEKEGYKLKVKQAKLYIWSSLTILILASYFTPDHILQIWLAGFLIPFYFDRKASQKRKSEYRSIYENK